MRNLINKSININDIAKKANVSISTVSRYLNGGYVSTNTKEKINEVINQFNWIPNPNIRSIKKKDNVIFVISPSIIKPRTQFVIDKLVSDVDTDAFVFLAKGNYNEQHYIDTIINTINRNPKHVILFLPFYSKKVVDYINSIKNHSFIIISPITTFSFHHKVINVDDYIGFKRLVKTIIKNENYNNIAYIGRNPYEHQLDMVIYRSRLEAFESEISKYKSIKYETHIISKNDIENATKAIIDLYNKGFRNFVCGTHTIFRAGINNTLFNDCTFTDYGSNHNSDAANRYKYKVKVSYTTMSNIISNYISGFDYGKRVNCIPKIEVKN